MAGKPRPRWTAALFDLDGTLIDTRPGIQAALRAALGDVLGDETAPEQANLSLPLDAMILSAIPSASSEDQRRLSAAFRTHYDGGDWRQAEVYPGAKECLQTLRHAGVRAFVVTNKRSRAARRLLELFQLAPYFEALFGQPQDGAPTAKSELARRCLREAGLDGSKAVVVGDSDQDAAMALSQSMVFIAFTSGVGPLSQGRVDQDRIEMDSLKDVATYVADGTLWRKS